MAGGGGGDGGGMMAHCGMAEKIAVLLFAVIALVPKGSAADDKAQVQLFPTEKELHRHQNTSFVVTCFTQEAEWLGPKNKPVESMGKPQVSVSGNSTQKRLVFSNIGGDLSGNYTCRSKSNKEYPNFFTLTVVEPVSFGGPGQQTALQSNNATLQCLPRGKPTPEISWLRNGQLVQINKTGKFDILKGALLVKNVTRVDAGPYVCRAVQYMVDESVLKEYTINLTVQHQPEWHADYAKTSDLVYGYLGGLANLTCVAEAQPAGNITWLREKKVVEVGENVTIFGDGRNSTLQLNLTDASLFGDYTCKATNALGTRARVLTLKWGTRAPRPSPPQPRKAADARHALIRVDPPPPPEAATPAPEGDPANAGGEGADKKKKGKAGDPAPTALDLTGLRLLVRPVGAGHDAPERVIDLPFNQDYEYTVPDLEPGSWYQVRAQWRNAAGLSEESPPGEIHTSDLNSPSGTTALHGHVTVLLLVTVAAILSS